MLTLHPLLSPDITNHSLFARRDCLVSSHLSSLFLASSTCIQKKMFIIQIRLIEKKREMATQSNRNLDRIIALK
jgi:hypothetical protein